MAVNIIVLILVAFIGGLTAYMLRSASNIPFKATLTIAGSYLFAITIVHVLPELFEGAKNTLFIGIFILAGFFLQQLLEFFSAGAEHGHLHPLKEDHHHHGNHAIGVVLALAVHSFLEGTVLGHSNSAEAHNNWSILVGISLHKLPAAFALMTILICHYKTPTKPIIYLTIFAIASPLGVVFSSVGIGNNLISEEFSTALFALVAGGFLHISTTIVFEGSPGHELNKGRLLYSVIGAGIGVLFEYLH